MDFYRIKERTTKSGTLEIFPDFTVGKSKDLMVRGKSFYAIWDAAASLWSTDEYDVQRLVDEDLNRYAEEVRTRFQGSIHILKMGDFSSGSWRAFKNYLSLLADNSKILDEKVTFLNTEVQKHDYISKRLPYPLGAGDISAYDEIASTLYTPQQRDKFEWAIGSIIAGDARYIQKFIVFYGPAGAGKSTIINVIQELFPGYYASFEAAALTGTSNTFATEVFRSNPLIAIQHDGDLSQIKDNSKLNSIVSHEEMTMNEKFKSSYTARINAFLIMGSNKAVKITDAKSGLIRRLIDIQPTGEKVPVKRYTALVAQMKFELGAIAQHCLDRYRELGRDYYSDYKPIEMMLQTDSFYNYVEHYYDLFTEQDAITLEHAYALYREYTVQAGIEYQLPSYKFREELKNYFKEFHIRAKINGEMEHSVFKGFDISTFYIEEQREVPLSLILDRDVSLLDGELAHQPAQYGTTDEVPGKKWKDVRTTLEDIDTKRLHYVKLPLNHIVIDFDLVGPDGEKSLELNMEAASQWPPTYAEFSKGGNGIHLHYIYEGDASLLSRVHSEGIEVKVFTGDSSLRRKLSKCNDIPIASINSGLALKEKRVITDQTIQSERGLRDLIERNLNKEIHSATKPSIDFIYQILEDAYNNGLSYDVTNLRGRIIAFANGSTNQSEAALKLVTKMKFQSEGGEVGQPEDAPKKDESPLVFFDCEVFPNLFIICWKYEGSDQIVRMINPTPSEVSQLAKMKLVGFNCRRYDNHILYGRIMGFSNEQLYKLSQKIINKSRNAFFGEAYNLSYVDIFEYASKKQGLKKWQIELGIHHQELHIPWDEPVPEELWETVADYCDNDVRSTEAVHQARIQDYNARLILAKLSGLTVNSTTQQHSTRIIFGTDRNPQSKFIYTDLATGNRIYGEDTPVSEHDAGDVAFEGYTFKFGKSEYRDEDPSEGGYVYAEPGMYQNVAVIDVASMHPTSIVNLNAFGPYTKNFKALMTARLAIKRRDFETAQYLFDGALKPYLGSDDDAEALSYALKIVINIVYGMTSAGFENAFRDPRNVDNIVAKRGALFMIDLKNFVQDLGYQVVHIKTDSIKIPDADQKIIDLVMEFGQDYGYEFEHEATYDQFCLVNNAVYIAKVRAGRKPEHWEAVGAQFQHPYVFKTLFTKEPLTFKDICETKTVTSSLYLDFTENDDTPMALRPEGSSNLRFVGKAGSFVPVVSGGGELLREKDGKYHSATGAKGYRWIEAEVMRDRLDESQPISSNEQVDWSYFRHLTDDAIDNISNYGDFEMFTHEGK